MNLSVPASVWSPPAWWASRAAKTCCFVSEKTSASSLTATTPSASLLVKYSAPSCSPPETAPSRTSRSLTCCDLPSAMSTTATNRMSSLGLGRARRSVRPLLRSLAAGTGEARDGGALAEQRLDLGCRSPRSRSRGPSGSSAGAAGTRGTPSRASAPAATARRRSRSSPRGRAGSRTARTTPRRRPTSPSPRPRRTRRRRSPSPRGRRSGSRRCLRRRSDSLSFTAMKGGPPGRCGELLADRSSGPSHGHRTRVKPWFRRDSPPAGGGSATYGRVRTSRTRGRRRGRTAAAGGSRARSRSRGS